MTPIQEDSPNINTTNKYRRNQNMMNTNATANMYTYNR